MKKLAVLFFVLSVSSAFAYAVDGDGDDQWKSFSLELGSGIQPLHMTLAPSHKEVLALADEGLVNNRSGEFCPVISISEVWRLSGHWELCLSEGVSWKYFKVSGFDSFGIDPAGKPRYDLTTAYPAGWRTSLPVGAIAFQARLIWSPKWKVTMYSALGVGLTTATMLYPMPVVTPIALRYGGDHFYFFAEATMSPLASLGHGGFGWRF